MNVKETVQLCNDDPGHSEPLVSVVMPMYNNRAYVADAVESALDQEYSNIELIVVDDGSTDGSHQVIESFDDPRIRLIRTENRGPSAARNAGVAMARGDLITFLDSDDLLTRQSISSRVDALTQCNADVALSWNHRSVPLGAPCGPSDVGADDDESAPIVYGSSDVRQRIIENRFSLATWSILMKKEIFDEVKGFDEDCKIHVDVEFFSRVAALDLNIIETFRSIYIYRRRPGSVSSIESPTRAAEALKTLRKICKNLAPWLEQHPESVGQKLFNRCIHAYPHWTEDHRLAMEEAKRLMNGRAFDLSCVGGPKAQAIARLFGWRAGKAATRLGARTRRAWHGLGRARRS